MLAVLNLAFANADMTAGRHDSYGRQKVLASANQNQASEPEPDNGTTSHDQRESRNECRLPTTISA